jgi:hypothetical protein
MAQTLLLGLGELPAALRTQGMMMQLVELVLGDHQALTDLEHQGLAAVTEKQMLVKVKAMAAAVLLGLEVETVAVYIYKSQVRSLFLAQ